MRISCPLSHHHMFRVRIQAQPVTRQLERVPDGIRRGLRFVRQLPPKMTSVYWTTGC